MTAHHLALLGAALTGWLLAARRPAAARLARLPHRPAGPRARRPATVATGRPGDRMPVVIAAVRRRTAREDAAWRSAVIGLCDGFAAELRAGLPAEQALIRACRYTGPDFRARWAPLVEAATRADAVPEAMRDLADHPGAGGLRPLAACWRVGVDAGAGLAGLVDRLTATLRDEAAHRVEISAALAGPKATARLLAVLPLAGIAMAAAVGARPVAFLLTTPAGLGCLVAGLGLNAVGMVWTGRLAAPEATEKGVTR